MIAPIWESARSLASRPLLDQWWFERVPVVRSVCVCVVRRRIFLFSVMLALSRAPVKAEHRDPAQSVSEGESITTWASAWCGWQAFSYYIELRIRLAPFFLLTRTQCSPLHNTHTHTWLLNTEKKDKILNKLNILEQRINRQHTVTFFE